MEIPGYPNYYINKKGTVTNVEKGIIVTPTQNQQGYWRVRLGKTTISLHRLLALTYIPNPENYRIVDHINRDNTDNRLENLRWVCDKESVRNRGTPKNSVTGEKNISYIKNHRGNMVYHIEFTERIDGKVKALYKHDCQTLEEAIKCRDEFITTGKKTQHGSTNQKFIMMRNGKFITSIKLFHHYSTHDTMKEAIETRDKILSGD